MLIRDRPDFLKAFQDELRQQPESLKAFLDDLRRQPESWREFLADIQQQPEVVNAIKNEWRTRDYQARLAREVALDRNYRFTFDFVSPVAEKWQTLLQPLREKTDLNALEIGSFEGRSAVWFLENLLTHPTDKLVCIDTFEVNEALFDHNISVSGASEKVTKLKGSSAVLVPPLPFASFDLIYIDGDHHVPNVFMDGILCWERLKPGGIMIFDDYLWRTDLPEEERPELAVDLCLHHIDGYYDLLLKGYQVIIRKHQRRRRRGSTPDHAEG
jgi:predicted O-methyltransferase YrrM